MTSCFLLHSVWLLVQGWLKFILPRVLATDPDIEATRTGSEPRAAKMSSPVQVIG